MRYISCADSDKIEEFINSMDANELLTLIDSFKMVCGDAELFEDLKDTSFGSHSKSVDIYLCDFRDKVTNFIESITVNNT